MKLFLHPLSAMSFWLTARVRPTNLKRVPSPKVAEFRPTAKTEDFLARTFPYMPGPIHVLVTEGRRNRRNQFCFHRLPKDWDDIGFCLIAPGVYAPTPEATFIAMGRYLSVPEMVYLGGALCGDFALDPARPSGVAKALPVSSPSAFGCFADAHPGFRGIVGARPALPLVQEGAESPPEVFMRMVLCLPRRYGGLAVAGAGANWSYLPSEDAQAISGRDYVRPDLLFRNGTKMVSVEYDSDSIHLVRGQASRDESKRLALESDGAKVISIRPDHLANPVYMKRVAREIERRLGFRQYPEPEDFYLKQEQLFCMDRSFSRFIVRA